MTPARRLTIAAAALAASAALVLTGCSNQDAGSAATFSDGRISEADLNAQVSEVLEAKGQTDTTEDPVLVQQTLGRMITTRLIDQLADDSGITVTQGEIDSMIANYESQLGGAESLRIAFLSENVAPSQIESFLRLQLQAQALGIELNPRGSAEEQGMAVYEAVSEYSQEVDTTVSPRFGTWDPQSLSLGPVPNDLSVPPLVQ